MTEEFKVIVEDLKGAITKWEQGESKDIHLIEEIITAAQGILNLLNRDIYILEREKK